MCVCVFVCVYITAFFIHYYCNQSVNFLLLLLKKTTQLKSVLLCIHVVVQGAVWIGEKDDNYSSWEDDNSCSCCLKLSTLPWKNVIKKNKR